MAARSIALLAFGTIIHAAAGTGPLLTVVQRDRTPDPLAPPSVDVSANGRYVAFESLTPLVPADTNDRRDVYVLDLQTRIVTLESSQAGAWIDDAHPRLSADGRYLVYESTPAKAAGSAYPAQIIWSDRREGESRVITRTPDGFAPNGASRTPDISDDGQLVVYVSKATDLVAGADANGRADDVYAYDVRGRTTSRVSVDDAGRQAAVGFSITPSLSGDGRWVVFASSAPLVSDPAKRDPSPARTERRQIFARDLRDGVTVCVSEGGDGVLGDDTSWSPSVNRDGRFVAFVSDARNLVAGARNRLPDVFLRDRQTRTTRLISRSAGGGEANGSSAAPAISADGRFVTFQSDASNLTCEKRCEPPDQDINLLWDVFLFDSRDGTTARLSADAESEWMEPSRGPAIDGSGEVVAFSSRHPIDALDRPDDYDLFVSVQAGNVRPAHQ